SLAIARSMVSAMQACAPLLWIGPTPVIEEMVVNPNRDANLPPRLQCLADLTAGYRKIAASLGVPFLDVREILDSTDGFTTSLKAGDGTHPTGDGHQLIAEIVTAWPEWRRVMDG
ncbi:MAG: GDSL-type esterase/lipase family protein, partial [Rhodospirillales bacterium]